ncbi:MAG: hypothetical protein RSE12_16895 [Fuscovulum sp.]|nr:MAG: hypothetical protein RSE12_16895 [Fuscovulum sp.]
MNGSIAVKTTNGVAVAGITMPSWMPTLSEASVFAADVVPILSAIWLLIQIIRFLRKGDK